ncbi:MAG: hypothetical protein ACR2FK_08090 [Sphingomicrobium sp.]
MVTLHRAAPRLIAATIALASIAAPSPAQSPPSHAAAPGPSQQDFDFETGTWATSVKVLRNPLTGKPPLWADYRGTSIIKPIMDGRANLVELSVEGPSGKIEGVSLRLYNPQTRQWSLNFASLRNGMLTAPVFGGFDATRRGLFYGQDMLDGRAILVRFVITPKSPDEAHFEQAYSADGGINWEVNWIAVDTRR